MIDPATPTTREPPQDIDRLIQDVLADLGFAADPKEVARRVRRLNYGLPAEDEFSVICAWLGRTKLLHKLDQHQSPLSSKANFQVPDVLVAFEAGGPFLVEIKVCNDQTISFKPDYHARLLRYAEMLNLPLLIAWKFHSVWTLFDIRHVALARKNFNISHNEAMRQNLLGVLAGDVAFKLAEGSGIHLDIAKEELIESIPTDEGYEETWMMRIAAVQFSAKGGEIRNDLHKETTQLFTTWDLESSEVHSPSHIRQSFIVGADGMEFAHRALVRLLEWEGGMTDRANWRSVLRSTEITKSIAHFGAALDRGLKEGVVTYIFHQQPVDMPEFIELSNDGEIT